jgi:undecaprenyl-diphosphatase
MLVQDTVGSALAAFDRLTIGALDALMPDSAAVDVVVRGMTGLDLLKGGVCAAIIWGIWFSVRTRSEVPVRDVLLRVIAGGAVAVVVGRALQILLPMRTRPLHDSQLDLPLGVGIDPRGWEDWSSFPSDHAVLFYALATGIFAADRRWGMFALLWVTFVICMPRIYVGLHYPTDIVGGALFGAGIMYVVLHAPLSHRVVDGVIRLERTHPALFYSAAFLVTWQVATIGEDVRRLASGMAEVIGIG